MENSYLDLGDTDPDFEEIGDEPTAAIVDLNDFPNPQRFHVSGSVWPDDRGRIHSVVETAHGKHNS